MCERKGYFYDNWSKLEIEVADELIYKSARKRCLGVICPCCCRCWCYRSMVIPCYIMPIGLGICTLLLLIGFGIFIIAPAVRVGNFKTSTCRVMSSDLEMDRMISCSCGGRRASCYSSYPCLNIFVEYKRHDGRRVNAQLFSSEISSTCSYLPSCSRDAFANQRDVRRYKRKYGSQGATFSCLYNPSPGSKEVIQKKMNEEFIRDFWLWPTVSIAICLILTLLTHFTCGCKYSMHKYPPEDVTAIAENLIARNIERLKGYSLDTRRRLVEECHPNAVVTHQPTSNPPQQTFSPPPANEVIWYEQNDDDEDDSDKPYLSTTV